MAKKTTVEVEMEDINLMPIMNLLCLLIPFLLLSAQFIQIGIILVDTPRRSRSRMNKSKDNKKKTLGLVVDITQDGYYISTKRVLRALIVKPTVSPASPSPTLVARKSTTPQP